MGEAGWPAEPILLASTLVMGPCGMTPAELASSTITDRECGIFAPPIAKSKIDDTLISVVLEDRCENDARRY